MILSRGLLRLGTRLYFVFLVFALGACLYALYTPPEDLRRYYTFVIVFAVAPAFLTYVVARVLAWVFSPDDRPVRQRGLTYLGMFVFALMVAGVGAIPYLLVI